MTKFVFWKCLICSHFILIWVTVWQILDSIWRSMDFWDRGRRLQVEWSVQIVGLLVDCLTFHVLPISHKESESVGCSFVSDSLQPHGLNPTRLICPWDSPGKNTHSGVSFPSPGDLPNPGVKPRSPALQLDSLPSEPPYFPLTAKIFHCKVICLCFILFRKYVVM